MLILFNGTVMKTESLKPLTSIEAMRIRRSVRTFDRTGIPDRILLKIKEHYQNPENLVGPFGYSARFEFLPLSGGSTHEGIRIGTYGIIKNPQGYLVGAVINTPGRIIDFGYAFEKLILKLTGWGLGSCWLGGTFSRSAFGRIIALAEDEIIPAVTPIGYPIEQPRFVEAGMRRVVGADNKKPWRHSFFFTDFRAGLDEETAGPLEIAFEMVRIAPSASNRQPWRLLLSADKKKIHFYLALDPRYLGNRRHFQMQRLDIGIALCHFELACRELGMPGSWEDSDPDIELPDSNYEYILTYDLE